MGGCLLDLICEASRIVLKLIGVLRSGRFSTYHYKQCMLYYYKRDTLTKSALRYSKQFKLRLLMTKMKSYICKSPMRKKLGGNSCRPVSLREDLEYRVNWNFTQLRNRESKLKTWLWIWRDGWLYTLFAIGFGNICTISHNWQKKFSSPTNFTAQNVSKV